MNGKLREIFRRFAGRLQAQPGLLKNGVASLIIKMAGLALGLGVSAILARELGAKEFGNYTFVLALVSTLTIPAVLGLPQVVLRETAKYSHSQRWPLVKGVWRWATSVAVLSSLAIVVFVLVGERIFRAKFEQGMSGAVLWGMAFAPFLVLGMLRGSALRGLHKVVQGQLPESIVRPAALILLLGAYGFVSSVQLTAAHAMFLTFLSAVVSFCFGAALLVSACPDEIKDAKIEYRVREWMVLIGPFALTSGFYTIVQYADLLIIGFFRANEDVGIYRIAAQFALLLNFGQQAVTSAISPQIVRLHEKGSAKELERLMVSGARYSVVFALALALGYVLFGMPLIRVFFGPDYEGAYWPLLILVFGQLINSGMGAVGVLLNMCGYERETTRGVMFSALVNLVLNFALVPYLGIYGAAIATAASMVSWNMLLSSACKSKLGLRISAF